MAKQRGPSEETKFLRGDAGVDGVATEEAKDEAAVELDKAREQLLRGRTYLGREFLTWLLWQSESGDPLVKVEDTGLEVLFLGKLVLKGIHGDVHEVSTRGTLAPYSAVVRFALEKGLLVHSGRLRFTHGEKVYEATLDAEFLDIRAAKLPDLLTEEDDDQLSERLVLVEQLAGFVEALMESFLAVRTTRAWKQAVRGLRSWMEAGGQTALVKAKKADAPSRKAS